MGSRRAAWAALVDVAAVVVFVVIGRRNHDEGSAIAEAARVATPFLIGLGAGWVAARAWRQPFAVRTALVVWPVTVVVGMLLRQVASDRGTAASFIIVATVFLGATLVGWRALATKLA